MLTRFKQFHQKYRKYIILMAVLLGFLVDIITLTQIDRVFDNIIFITHLTIIGGLIIALFSKNTKRGIRWKIPEREKLFNTIITFSFGALFSGFIIFYSRSGSFASSWPFILLLAALMIGTEVKRAYYQNIIFQISFFYLALFSYLIFFLPVVFAKVGVEMFIASGVASLVVIFLYTRFLKKIDKTIHLEYRKKIWTRVVAIFLLFNFLYFTNIIPPVPLSLKFKGVYHDLQTTGENTYSGVYEEAPWYNIFGKRSRTIHKETGESVYVFASVFAPTRLKTSIFHSWHYYDSEAVRWVKTDRIKIPISGGRDEGFRGYSMKRNLWAGKWKVIIETERGQRLGQIRFTISDKNKIPTLIQEQL
jgi:hypothetical protein